MLPMCEQCGRAADYTVTITKGAYAASISTCGAVKCFVRGSGAVFVALDLTDMQNDLSSEHQSDEAPPKSGRRRKGYLRLVQ